MSTLFINGSPNKNGNTAHLAKALLGNGEYETLNLTDYRINVYGQKLEGDQFDDVLAAIKAADIVVIGSPLYWHNICGSVRTLLDRFYVLLEVAAFVARHFISYFKVQLRNNGCLMPVHIQ